MRLRETQAAGLSLTREKCENPRGLCRIAKNELYILHLSLNCNGIGDKRTVRVMDISAARRHLFGSSLLTLLPS